MVVTTRHTMTFFVDTEVVSLLVQDTKSQEDCQAMVVEMSLHAESSGAVGNVAFVARRKVNIQMSSYTHFESVLVLFSLVA